MAYNILSIRNQNDPVDPLYPQVINKGKSVKTQAADGTNIIPFKFVFLRVSERQPDQSLKTLGDFDATGLAHITDSRVIIVSHAFKKPDTGFLLFDMPTFYTLSLLKSKIQTAGRALVGHIFYENLFRIAAKGTGTHKKQNSVRLHMAERTDGEVRRELTVQFYLVHGTNPRPIAREIAHREGQHWLGTSGIPEEARSKAKALSEVDELQTSDEKFSWYDMSARTLEKK